MKSASPTTLQSIRDTTTPPSGMRVVTLEEVVDPFPSYWGADQPTSSSKEFTVLGVGNVTNDGALDLTGVSRRHLEADELSGVAKEGDLLVVKSSGSASNIRSGKTAICPPELSGKIACSNFMMRLVVRRNVADPYLLWLILNSPLAKNFIRAIVAAATYPNIKWENYRRFSFPLPPLAEQRRIAGRLREQLAAMAQARAAVQAQTETLDTLSHAVLRESLSNGNTQPVRFADCLREVTKGIGDDWRKYPVLGATRAGLAPAKEGVGKNPGRYKPVRAGTIFYNPMRILLGSIAMLDEDDAPGITSPDYVVMTAVECRLSARWFYQWFRSRYGAEFIKSMTRGAVRERLMFRRLAPASIAVPEIRRQEAAARQFAEIKKAKAKLAEQLETLDRLPAALLREAFAFGGCS